ncbi:MAG: HipA N-terminal domain-containing protein [Bacteroidales bacterium]|nr:HipA N-terminal domain-containing protein [Bacteroidales bacterium]
MRKAEIKFNEDTAGFLSQDENGFHFIYEKSYLNSEKPISVSLTLPLQENAFDSPVLFPFFDGLIPEGWLLDIAETNWKLDSRDRMGLLLACCKDCIGAVSVFPIENNES